MRDTKKLEKSEKKVSFPFLDTKKKSFKCFIQLSLSRFQTPSSSINFYYLRNSFKLSSKIQNHSQFFFSKKKSMFRSLTLSEPSP